MTAPLVTIAVPSFNQADFINEALVSIFEQNVPVEVFVMDGGSTDGSVDIIRKWAPRLSGWRSRPDEGQAAAINEGISQGRAPYVCWINSDDWFLSGGLNKLLDELSSRADVPAVYGRVWNIFQKSNKLNPVWVEPFSKKRLAMRCIISQPGTLIRRNAWEAVGGLNDHLQFSMDYDLWWRLYKKFGELSFMDDFVAVNRVHEGTKTRNFRQQHNDESVAIVKKYNGKVPLKWLLLRPYSVWFRTIFG
jgi:glycosyltransferase involved in cell wall biosynthesis